ncbi:acyl-CoA dehydrogenase family protein [Novosphingobium sp.]|uniref:acyl-CoA dehydrogenase family protein n=1 Tax=Novosphingobium sp. TaxID=1874826 RepID=UPI00286E5982|nr:acyl-CoA dehydrogenase family protein [Novosphingobium sp.]
MRSKVLLGEHLSREDHLRWHGILAEGGLLVAHWPEEWGGRGWTRLQRWVFENELYRAGSPWLVPFGITYVAPVIYTFGNAAQKARWLGPIARAETWWAQGYSEPGAGSDLAAVRTTAVRDGAHYVVNGQKTWTTMAHWANWMFALVRTDSSVAPQRGISFLLIDMASPGVSVRPIGTIDGEHHINEIFLEDVRVPTENLIGEEGGGWTYAKFLLGNERLLAAEVGRAQRLMVQLQHFLQTPLRDGRVLAADLGWKRRCAGLEARILGVESLSYDLLAQAQSGRDPGALASVLKVLGSELIQSITSAQVDALGAGGLAHHIPGSSLPADRLPLGGAGAIDGHLHDRAATIYGGSSEIQRNILAKVVLEL